MYTIYSENYTRRMWMVLVYGLLTFLIPNANMVTDDISNEEDHDKAEDILIETPEDFLLHATKLRNKLGKGYIKLVNFLDEVGIDRAINETQIIKDQMKEEIQTKMLIKTNEIILKWHKFLEEEIRTEVYHKIIIFSHILGLIVGVLSIILYRYITNNRRNVINIRRN